MADGASGRREDGAGVDDAGTDGGDVCIRPARAGELRAVQEIEQAAAERFAEIGMEALLAAEPAALHVLAGAQRDGRLLVASDPADVPIGFALLGRVDGLPHLLELDVRPEHGRRGVGRRLVMEILRIARTAGGRALTLTTYRDVPWNGPFYGRLGFRELPEAALGPELAAIRRRERAAGLDRLAPRVAMRRPLGGPTSAAEG